MIFVVVLAGLFHLGKPLLRSGGLWSAGAIPSGSAYTPASWAHALLAAGRWSQDSCNMNAITAWEAAEGGNWQDAARYNPLNTTQTEPGSYAINSASVQAYTSWHEGFTATLTTLGYGRYAGVRAALASAGSAQAVADAVASSGWGTSPFTASC